MEIKTSKNQNLHKSTLCSIDYGFQLVYTQKKYKKTPIKTCGNCYTRCIACRVCRARGVSNDIKNDAFVFKNQGHLSPQSKKWIVETGQGLYTLISIRCWLVSWSLPQSSRAQSLCRAFLRQRCTAKINFFDILLMLNTRSLSLNFSSISQWM